MNVFAILASWLQQNSIDPNAIKLSIMAVTGLAKDALHIYVGLMAFLLIAAFRDARLGSKLALFTVLLAAGAGEAVDHSLDYMIPHGEFHLDDGHWHDIWNTCFWPIVLFLLARFMRLNPARKAEEGSGTPPESGNGADEPLE